MLVKKFKVEKVRKRLKEILLDRSDDPKITVQIFERDALYQVFEEVYNKGIEEGRRVEKKVLNKKIRSIL